MRTAHALEASTAAMGQGQDTFAQLELMKGVARVCARQVIGEKGGRIRDLIPHHSLEFRKLKARLTLLKVVRWEVHARRHSGPLLPSLAMRRAWDAGLYLRPATFDMLSSLRLAPPP